MDRQVLFASFKQAALTGKYFLDGSQCHQKTRTIAQMVCSYQKFELRGNWVDQHGIKKKKKVKVNLKTVLKI